MVELWLSTDLPSPGTHMHLSSRGNGAPSDSYVLQNGRKECRSYLRWMYSPVLAE